MPEGSSVGRTIPDAVKEESQGGSSLTGSGGGVLAWGTLLWGTSLRTNGTFNTKARNVHTTSVISFSEFL